MTRQRKPERTCIGCRNAFTKDEIIRIVGSPSGAVLDYREKLPGRAAYVCPRRQCIEKAFTNNLLSRALKLRVTSPQPAEFITLLQFAIKEKIRALIAIAVKAGKVAAGYSAVDDALGKDRVAMVLFAEDIANGTREKIDLQQKPNVRNATLFTRDELGRILNRELIGVIAFEDKGFADAVWRETERLKSLIINHE